MPAKSAMSMILRHIEKIMDELDDSEVDQMIGAIRSAKTLFVIGAGRSGLVAKSLAMRLMQLGLDTHVIGEVTTPAVTKGDLFIAVSGSGGTESIITAAKTAKKIDAKVLTITSYPNSPLGEISDVVVTIHGRTKIDDTKNYLKDQITGTHSSLTPMGTLFEDTAMIFFDGIVARLMVDLGKGEEDMKLRHSTVE